jgi:hypothetical protein
MLPHDFLPNGSRFEAEAYVVSARARPFRLEWAAPALASRLLYFEEL